MKKYHLMEIYQVSPKVGYLKSGEKYCPITVFDSPDNEYKLEATITMINTKKIIMVERIFPSLVREVKTGIIFPIVNFKRKNQCDKDSEYISCLYSTVHTFVCSENDKLLSVEVTTSDDLREYNRRYPDNKKLKEELQTIITTGKANMETKIAEEIYRRQREYGKTAIEDSTKRQERIQVRRLQRQFKREQRKV